MKTELLPSDSTAQTTSTVLTKFIIQMIHLAFSSEHSMNILIWTFIQFSFWTMRGSFLNVRPNIPGMFHECYRAHWAVFINSRMLDLKAIPLKNTGGGGGGTPTISDPPYNDFFSCKPPLTMIFFHLNPPHQWFSLLFQNPIPNVFFNYNPKTPDMQKRPHRLRPLFFPFHNTVFLLLFFLLSLLFLSRSLSYLRS